MVASPLKLIGPVYFSNFFNLKYPHSSGFQAEVAHLTGTIFAL